MSASIALSRTPFFGPSEKTGKGIATPGMVCMLKGLTNYPNNLTINTRNKTRWVGPCPCQSPCAARPSLGVERKQEKELPLQ